MKDDGVSDNKCSDSSFVVSSLETQTTKNNTVRNSNIIPKKLCITKYRIAIYKTKQQNMRKIEYYNSIHKYLQKLNCKKKIRRIKDNISEIIKQN